MWQGIKTLPFYSETGGDDMKRILIEKHRYWEMIVEVDNDWGEPPYIERRTYPDRESLEKALERMRYHEFIEEIREVVEYQIEYKDDENE